MQTPLWVHSISANTINNAAKFSHNSIQGHFHSSFAIAYHADKARIRWSMSVGALLDPNSPAARYGAGAILKRPILGCGLLLSHEGNTLVIPDMHLPYQHQDAFNFLWNVAEAYDCIRILNVGDLYDHHAGSYHESEMDAYNAEDEYRLSKMYAKELQDMFPNMVITNGNHDKIPVRKLKSVGLPPSMLSNYNNIYETKDTWVWCDEYWFDSLGSQPMLVPMVLNKKGRWDGNL